MKRLILLLICALYVTTAAQAQISFYGEWCRKGGGEKTIMIFDMKEKTLRKGCVKCTKNGNGIVVKTHIPDNRVAQNKK